MGQWPFGIQTTTDQRLLDEALNCLDFLDSYLQFEEWEMDQIEAQEEDDDDDDVDIVSEDEGYDSGDDEGDIDQWDFGIALVLWHIQLGNIMMCIMLLSINGCNKYILKLEAV